MYLNFSNVPIRFLKRVFLAYLYIRIIYNVQPPHSRSHFPYIDILQLETENLPTLTHHIVEAAKVHENLSTGDNLQLLVYMRPVIFPSWVRREVKLNFGVYNRTGDFETPTHTVHLYYQPFWAFGYQMCSECLFLDPKWPFSRVFAGSSSEHLDYGYQKSLEIVDLLYTDTNITPEPTDQLRKFQTLFYLLLFLEFLHGVEIWPSLFSESETYDAGFMAIILVVILKGWYMFEIENYCDYVKLSGTSVRSHCLRGLLLHFVTLSTEASRLLRTKIKSIKR